MTMIVMTGDGARGNWTLGTMIHLLDGPLKPSGYVGISSGALNAFLLSQIKPDAICDTARKISDRSKLFSFNWNIFSSAGLFTSKPLEKILKNLLKNHRLDTKDRLPGWVSYSDLENGTIHYVDVNTLQSQEEIIEVVLSAVSIPGYVKAVRPPKYDAGVLEINPVSQAIILGAKRIVVVFARPIMANVMQPPSGWFQTAQVAYRSLDLMMHRMATDDLAMSYMYDDLESLEILETPTYLGDALDFKHADIFFEMGLSGDFVRTVVKSL